MLLKPGSSAIVVLQLQTSHWYRCALFVENLISITAAWVLMPTSITKKSVRNKDCAFVVRLLGHLDGFRYQRRANLWV